MGKGQSKAREERDVVSPLPKKGLARQTSKRRLSQDSSPLEELDPTSPKLALTAYATLLC